MPDCVLDASVVYMANGDIAKRKPGNVLDRRLVAIEEVVSGAMRLRYNRRLLGEYQRLIQEFRNDVIELFFAVLDSDRCILVKRSTLSRQHFATCKRVCRWPSHDQHLLAAALGGDEPWIFVTEAHLAQCAAQILASFAIHVAHLA